MRGSLIKRQLAPLWAILGLFSLGLLSACSHYYLGRSTPLPFDSLAIVPVKSQCFAPQLQALINDQLVHSFVSDGTVSILPEDKAEATLHITLSEFEQLLSSTREADTGLARSYDVTLVADCTLVDNKTQTPLFEHCKVSSTLNLQVESSFVDVQYQAMPALAKTLAQKIRDRVLDNW